MAKCPQCGKDTSILERDLVTGACRECQKVGARPATLGCGTLIIIALVVALVTNSMRNNVAETRREISQLQAAIERLEDASAQQLEEMRALRRGLEERGPGATPRQ